MIMVMLIVQAIRLGKNMFLVQETIPDMLSPTEIRLKYLVVIPIDLLLSRELEMLVSLMKTPVLKELL